MENKTVNFQLLQDEQIKVLSALLDRRNTLLKSKKTTGSITYDSEIEYLGNLIERLQSLKPQE